MFLKLLKKSPVIWDVTQCSPLKKSTFQRTTCHYVPENWNVPNHSCKKVKSYCSIPSSLYGTRRFINVSLFPNLSQMNPVRYPSHYDSLHKRYFHFRFSDQNSTFTSYASHSCYVPPLASSPCTCSTTIIIFGEELEYETLYYAVLP